MNLMMMTTMTIAILVGMTACDATSSKDMKLERSDKNYRVAMEDYNAGRLDSAVEGFRKVCKDDPSNASARFQLACLLQDGGKNYLDALCAFREYVFQQPDSDKARVAIDRAAICEKEYSMTLAHKYGLDGGAALLKELEESRKRLSQSEARCAKLDQDFAQAMRRISALQQEKDRLVKMIKTESAIEDVTKPVMPTDAKALLDDSDDASTDRVKLSRDVAALRMEEKLETEASSSLVPPQPENAKEKRDAMRSEKSAKKEPLHETRPSTYVVEEGDTLYKIAMRFYGTSSAWKKIRDANKALISVDGRVKAGWELKLP